MNFGSLAALPPSAPPTALLGKGRTKIIVLYNLSWWGANRGLLPKRLEGNLRLRPGDFQSAAAVETERSRSLLNDI
jgi:hypothetical protein